MKKNYAKKLNLKKIASYSAMAGSLLIAGKSAEAQIVYTDLEPDETVGIGDSYDLDMDDDGTADFTFAINSFTIPDAFFSVTSLGDTILFNGIVNQAQVLPNNGNSIIGSTVSALVYPLVLDDGDNIGAGEDFYDASTQNFGAKLYVGNSTNFTWNTYGSWIGEDEQYIGVMLDIDGDSHYGWIRMGIEGSTPDEMKITLYDFAYESTADASIEAGVSSAIQTMISADKINAYSFGTMVNINVKDLNAANATVEIYNTLGQSVYSNTLNQKGMQIDLNSVTDGLYTLHINADGAVYNKQLFISK